MSEVKIVEVRQAIKQALLSCCPEKDRAMIQGGTPPIDWSLLARAAIRAMRSPTEEMIRVGDVLHGLIRADVLEIWEVMCDEALR